MKINELHDHIRKRYTRPDEKSASPAGYLLDYADKNGHTLIPTPEECEKSFPNPLGWGVSIENGAFFGGLYLFGLCEKYEISPDEELRQEMILIANGLLKLCDIGKTDGFIARGVADDFFSHYPYSSEDQFGPWLLGLWKLSHSAACDENLRGEIKKRLIRSINGVRNAGWRIPTEVSEITRGSYAGADFRGAANLVFTAAVGVELRLLDKTEFLSLVNGHPRGSIYSRVEIISHGFAPDMIRDTGLIQFWIDACAQICLSELMKLDDCRKDYYLSGLRADAFAVSGFFDEYKKLPEPRRKIDFDWRKIREIADPSPENEISEAGRQCGYFFGVISPGMGDEKKFLGQAVFADLIAIAGGDEKTSQTAFAKLSALIGETDWENIGYNLAFAVVTAYYIHLNKKGRVK